MKLPHLAILTGLGALAYYAYKLKQRAEALDTEGDYLAKLLNEQMVHGEELAWLVEQQRRSLEDSWIENAALRGALNLTEGQRVEFYGEINTDDPDLQATEEA